VTFTVSDISAFTHGNIARGCRVELWSRWDTRVGEVAIESGTWTQVTGAWPAATLSITISEHDEYDPLPRWWPFGAHLRLFLGRAGAEELVGVFAPIEVTRTYPADVYLVECVDVAAVGTLGDIPRPIPIGKRNPVTVAKELLEYPRGTDYAHLVTVTTEVTVATVHGETETLTGSVTDSLRRVMRDHGLCVTSEIVAGGTVVTLRPHTYTRPPARDLDYRESVTSVTRRYGRSANRVVTATTPDKGPTTYATVDATGPNAPAKVGVWAMARTSATGHPADTALRVAANAMREITVTAIPDPAMRPRDTVDLIPLDGVRQRCVVTETIYDLGGSDMRIVLAPMLEDWAEDQSP
jgi:hypothetical protein